MPNQSKEICGLRLKPSGLVCCGLNRKELSNMSTLSAGAILQTRYARLSQKHMIHDASIENTAGNTPNNTSIELPAEIRALITGSDFWVRAKTNRYKKLIREGHLDKLLHLAQEAQSKERPANWFAAACSKERWEQYTVPYFAKLAEVTQKAEQVARRLGTKVNRFIYKMIWRGANVERWAVAAEEVRHDKPGQSRERYFAWLCVHEQRLTT
jgi:hypothetical protein